MNTFHNNIFPGCILKVADRTTLVLVPLPEDYTHPDPLTSIRQMHIKLSCTHLLDNFHQ